jgi:DNA-binding NtrC family response regulator
MTLTETCRRILYIMKILVVDDEAELCELLEEFFSLEGFEVITAQSGEKALALFEAERPAAVVLDIKMPGLSGMEVLRRIKEADPPAIVIMVSAFGDVATIQEALQRGAYRYLEKPVDLEQLKDTVLEATAHSGGEN